MLVPHLTTYTSLIHLSQNLRYATAAAHGLKSCKQTWPHAHNNPKNKAKEKEKGEKEEEEEEEGEGHPGLLRSGSMRC